MFDNFKKSFAYSLSANFPEIIPVLAILSLNITVVCLLGL